MRSFRKGSLETRARRRLAFETPALDEVSARRIEELADLQDLRAQLRDALNELSSESARAVYLRVGLEMPYVEVARELKCSEGAARVRVMRGLDRLRVVMEGAPE
jgi:RNA polymerase sigma-70 factor (ECF subfamily)